MSLKRIFQSAKQSDSSLQKEQQLTIAILLFRLVRSDGQAKMLELVHMSELLRKEFELTQEELESIFKVANDRESQTMSTNDLTSQIQETLSTAKRIKLVEYLWILAFADDRIDDSEISIIKNVAKQLKLSELEQVKAQENAEKHLGLDLF